jgi:hypothetical protein
MQHTYNLDMPQRNEEEMSAVVARMNKALDGMIEIVRSNRIKIAQDTKNVCQFKGERA